VSRAIDELERLIDDEDAHVRLRAAQQVLDRALGKASQPIDVATVRHDIELRNAREELERRLKVIRTRRDAATRTAELERNQKCPR